MIGVVLFGHERLAGAFASAACQIVGPMERVAVVDVLGEAAGDELERQLDQAIEKVDSGDGVLVLTDLFGGSPANFALARMKPGRVEVVCGMNLAMLLKVFDLRRHDLRDVAVMARAVAREGQDNIVVAGDMLPRRPTGTGAVQTISEA